MRSIERANERANEQNGELTDERPVGRSSGRAKRFGQRNMLAAADVSALFPDEPAPIETTGQVVEYPIADLWLDDQPRQLVPDATLARLIAEGVARPPRLLEEVRAVAATHPYYRGVREALEALAKTIAADGVLEPLLVVKRPAGESDGEAERLVIRDGHRRSLASLIAGRETVPVRVSDEPSALQATARALVVNIQRQDLTALEKGRWLLRLARLVEAGIREEQGVPDGPSVVEELARPVERDARLAPSDPAGEHALHVPNVPAGSGGALHAPNAANGEDARHVPNGSAGAGAALHVPNDASGAGALPAPADPLDTMARRALAAAVRRRVLELTGLGEKYYYNLLYLNRLTPEAQEAGLGLTEGQLRPVTSLPAADQPMIVRFIAERGLTSKESATLVGVAKSGDRDAVKRVMAKLAKSDVAPARAAVSWEPLLHAIPQDLSVRVSSLRAELAALPSERREVRLRSLSEQHRLAREFMQQIEEILTLYPAGDGAADDEA